jgi:hypothetical protein
LSDEDAMDVDAVRERLARAVSAQLGSLLSLTLLAGAVRGAAAVGLTEVLSGFAAAEVADTQRLVEKLTVLGGVLEPYEVPPLPSGDAPAMLRAFLDREEAVLETVHAVIDPSGQEPQSEALEHLVEHVLLRKQQQVDRLRLALS